MGAHVWGPRVPARPPVAERPAQRLVDGLVRRPARLPLLHADPRADDRGPRRVAVHPVRRGVQVRRHPRSGHAAVLLLGVRPPGPLPLPDAGAVRVRRHLLRAQRELCDLRRQREVDDGGRVLVLDRDQPDGARLGSPVPRPRRGQVPLVGGDRPRPRVPEPRHRAHLHDRRRDHHRRLPPVRRPVEHRTRRQRRGQGPPLVRGVRRRAHDPAVRVLGRAVPVQPRRT